MFTYLSSLTNSGNFIVRFELALRGMNVHEICIIIIFFSFGNLWAHRETDEKEENYFCGEKKGKS